MPRMQIPKKLSPILQKQKRFKIMVGGRGSAKSTTAADLCLMDAQVKSYKTACFREFQNSIDDSVHGLLASEIDRMQLHGFNVQEKTIKYNGNDAFKFKGLARNIQSIQSMQGFNRFWIEEGQTISTKSLRILTPTLRAPNSEIWVTANPGSSADPFSQRFLKPFEKKLNKDGIYEDDLHLIVKCNYNDNPWFPDVLEKERLYDEGHLSAAEYAHIWEGAYNDTISGAIIEVDWFNAAIDAHEKLGIKPRGIKAAAFDPSDEGDDDKGYCFRHGILIKDVRSLDTGDSADGADWAIDLTLTNTADFFTWDCDGLGVALKRQLYTGLQDNRVTIAMFKGSNAVDHPDSIYDPQKGESAKTTKTNKESFKNKRAQYYWYLRERFRKTYLAVTKNVYSDPDELISLSSNIEEMDQLRAELCRIPKVPNAQGLIQIMSKQKMVEQGIQSPNMGDAVMMSFASSVENEPDFQDINFKSLW